MSRIRTLPLFILIAILAIPTLVSCSGGSDNATPTTTEYISMVTNTSFVAPDDSFHAEYPVDETEKKVYARTQTAMEGFPEHTVYFTEVYVPGGTIQYSVSVYPDSVKLEQQFVSHYEDWDCKSSTTRDPKAGICSTTNEGGRLIEMPLSDGENLIVVKVVSDNKGWPSEADAFLDSIQLPVDA